jgi:hypothetical protein
MPQSYSPVYLPQDWSATSMGANNVSVDTCNDSTDKEVTLSACLDPNNAINQGSAATYSQNNLVVSGNSAHATVRTNILTDGSSKYVWEVTVVKHDTNIKIGAMLSNDQVAGSEQLGTNANTGQGWSFVADGGSGNFSQYRGTNMVTGMSTLADGDMYHFEFNNATGDVFVWRKAAGGSWAAENSGATVVNDDGANNGKTALAGAKVHLAGHLYQTAGTNLMRFNFSGPFDKAASATYVPFTQTATGVGNYWTLTPLQSNNTLTNGNLAFTGASNYSNYSTAPALPMTGKWYWEVRAVGSARITSSANYDTYVGVLSTNVAIPSGSQSSNANLWVWGNMSKDSSGSNGQKHNNSSVSLVPAVTFGDNSILMIAVDMDNNSIWFGNDGTWAGSGDPAGNSNAAFSNLSGQLMPYQTLYDDSATYNFGAKGFVHSPPTGFKALKTTNLPAPTVKNPDDGYVQVLDTGANIESALATARSGYSTYMEVFKDLDSTAIWQVRFSDDTSNGLDFESTAAKTTFSAPSGSNNFLGWAFNMNATHGMFTAEVSHTNGSDTNTAHSLGAGLKMAVVKITNTTGGWYWSHPGMTTGYNIEWNQHTTGEQNSVVYAGIDDTNVIVKSSAPTGTYRVLAIVEVEGFSSLATMVGNGSADGPFVYTGMQPEFMMCRRHTGGVNTFAYVRQGRNPENTMLEFGFKQRTNSNDFNQSTIRNFFWAIGRPFGGSGVAQAKAR